MVNMHMYVPSSTADVYGKRTNNTYVRVLNWMGVQIEIDKYVRTVAGALIWQPSRSETPTTWARIWHLRSWLTVRQRLRAKHEWHDSPHNLKCHLCNFNNGVTDRDWLCAKGSGPSMSDMTALTIRNAICVISKYGVTDRDWLCAKGSGPSMSDMTALTIWNAIYVISKYDVLDRDWLYAKGSGQAWVTWQPSQLETPST